MKYKRQNMILGIIKQKEINTQKDLQEELEKSGFRVTQATLSRDIKELMLIKQPSENGYRYSARETKTTETDGIAIMPGGIVSIVCAMHTIVIKTLPGVASAAAAVIDSANEPRILGTVAGDDTVLVICRTPEKAEECLERIKRIF
ncbi:MAG: arginine repressor [Oscillospiraceae bacterium]|nr:arginine repressor [Oscillospiraceae bacterium]